jgi:hypothetical protein
MSVMLSPSVHVHTGKAEKFAWPRCPMLHQLSHEEKSVLVGDISEL